MYINPMQLYNCFCCPPETKHLDIVGYSLDPPS